MPEFRKKPVTIIAKRVGTTNIDSLISWMNWGNEDKIARYDGTNIIIQTLEGEIKASVGDWIIRGVMGEFYPCKHDIFRKTYENLDGTVVK